MPSQTTWTGFYYCCFGQHRPHPFVHNSTGSFHGTSISLIQHPSTTEEGHDMGQIILPESSPEKCINPLPASYTTVPAVVPKSGKPSVSPVSESMMIGNQSTIADAISKEVEWLEDINKIYTAGQTETDTRSVNAAIVGERTINDQSKARNKKAEAISWSAFHAERQTQVTPKCTSSLLPLVSDCAHSVAMISHALTVVSKAVGYLNLGQTVVNLRPATLCFSENYSVGSQGQCREGIIWWSCLVDFTSSSLTSIQEVRRVC